MSNPYYYEPFDGVTPSGYVGCRPRTVEPRVLERSSSSSSRAYYYTGNRYSGNGSGSGNGNYYSSNYSSNTRDTTRTTYDKEMTSRLGSPCLSTSKTTGMSLNSNSAQQRSYSSDKNYSSGGGSRDYYRSINSNSCGSGIGRSSYYSGNTDSSGSNGGSSSYYRDSNDRY